MSGFGARLKIFGTRFQILVPVLKKIVTQYAVLAPDRQFWYFMVSTISAPPPL